MRTTLATICVALVFVASTTAQDAKPDFSGTWHLDVAKSDFGGAPAPDSIVSVVEHKDPNLTITTTQKSQQGELTNTRNLTTDGKENVNRLRSMMGEQDITSTSKWNGKKLTNVFTLDIQGNTIDITENLELSDDRKVLSIARDLKTPQGDFHQTYVFNRH
jgi:hypothetical protein